MRRENRLFRRREKHLSRNDYSWLLKCGLLLCGFLLIVSQGLPRQSKLVCNRVEPKIVNCNLQQSFLGILTREQLLPALSKAVVVKEDKYHIYEIKLFFEDGEIDFGYSQGNYPREQEEAGAIAAQINGFLTSAKSSLVVQTSYTNWFLVGFCSAVIVWLLWFIKRIITGDSANYR